MHPLTPVTAGACGMVIVLVANNPWVSAAGLVIAAIVAFRRFLVATALTVPAAVGFALMYAPFGHSAWWGGLTSDGLHTALNLSLRLWAVIAVGLAAGAHTDVDRLMRALQVRAPAPFVYVIGSTVRLYPMARHRLEMLRRVASSRGIPVRTVRGRLRLFFPLIVGLIDDAALRSRPLQRLRIGEPGPRTVLRPVADPPLERALRWAMILLTLGIVVGVYAGAS
ncbi:energy-coupling factor transporter transmembrane component T family protein [Corynebacterium heidelbergense]|uniref:Cobalt ABC transporter permease n=1 Tax=Corynebacterium heidelbergense TaxID=2055947 RepID=A0A364V525_9CORY|nr:energy-coupling factor transporter transmembrane component T [Corynebacterium heidelbergense]RAV31729.1 cobalt ABC transporter permease [Corynebacterium heidelbergense]